MEGVLSDVPGSLLSPPWIVPGMLGAGSYTPPPVVAPTWSLPPAWRIIVRDTDTNAYLAEIDTEIEATFIPRFNDIGTWYVKVRYNESGAAQYFAGPNAITHPGIVLARGDRKVMSGPMTSLQRLYDPDGDWLVINGMSDLFFPFARVTIPDPVNGGGDQYNLGPGAASTLIQQAVYDHCVRTDLGRQVPALSTTGAGGVGPATFNQSRYANLLSTMKEIAAASGIAFDIIDMQLVAWMPANDGVVFSVELGTATSYSSLIQVPQWNKVIGGGINPGVSQQFDVEEDSTSVVQWGVIEEYYDRQDIANPPASPAPSNLLQQVTQEQVIAGAVPTGYQVVINETTGQAFARDFNVGDEVTVVIPGTTYVDIIRDCTITFATNAPVTVVPTVGYPSKTAVTAVLGQFSRAIKRLQAN